MQNTTERSSRSAEGLYKFFIYFVLVLLAVIIIVPVAWVFMASIKQNAEFYGNPWALPAGFYWQNFVNAWNGAKMGEYMLNSVIVTALALVLLLVIALPAAYCLSRFRFKGRKLLNTLFMAGLFINVNYIVKRCFAEPRKLFTERVLSRQSETCDVNNAPKHCEPKVQMRKQRLRGGCIRTAGCCFCVYRRRNRRFGKSLVSIFSDLLVKTGAETPQKQENATL